ncbi:hypothetical protein EXW96_22805 [Paenibacillus sp. JMULE4]|uniref:Wzz/FepE/Etk N-terminal domain-containing protein n=1 Tax=Paenibacillus sp. JMULE4 TaxID=2518342 RepID=UPI0015764278|nr:Wzz/FepE/Etk N-terminal domain-containing protein [Paenibacillus sp. JMULE4]NTZ20270.1 hypothetical protein [Paenibacillus sp. JMULE4]
MQEDLKLRDLIEILWSGKKLLILLVGASMLISAIYNYAIIEPTYEATSLVRINKPLVPNEKKVNINLKSFIEDIKTDAFVSGIIKNLNLDESKYSIRDVSSSINAEAIKDADLIKITVRGTDTNVITQLANTIAFKIAARIEVSDRSEVIVESQNRILELNDLISVSESVITEARKNLETTPEKIVTKKSLAEDPYLQSVISENSNLQNKQIGSIELINEDINPVYTNLLNKLTEESVNLAKLKEEKNVMLKKKTDNEKIIEEIQNIENGNSKVDKSIQVLSGMSAVFITPALDSLYPVSPRKVLNMALTAAAASLIGILIVFVRFYWKKTETILGN